MPSVDVKIVSLLVLWHFRVVHTERGLNGHHQCIICSVDTESGSFKFLRVVCHRAF